MSKLGGLEIARQVELGNIYIDNFDKEKVNPNSYNLKLHNKLLVYTDDVLDCKKENKTKEIIIPEEGYVLQPGELYLGRTVERTLTKNYVPGIDGRSSIGRLGIFVHVTAGFGDEGFEGYWTLEIACLKPIRIYPNMEICQVYYEPIIGEYEGYSKKGKYQDNNDVQASMLYKEF